MNTPEISAPDEEATYRKVTLRLIPFLFLCYILAFLDRVNVGFAKLQMLGAGDVTELDGERRHLLSGVFPV